MTLRQIRAGTFAPLAAPRQRRLLHRRAGIRPPRAFRRSRTPRSRRGSTRHAAGPAKPGFCISGTGVPHLLHPRFATPAPDFRTGSVVSHLRRRRLPAPAFRVAAAADPRRLVCPAAAGGWPARRRPGGGGGGRPAEAAPGPFSLLRGPRAGAADADDRPGFTRNWKRRKAAALSRPPHPTPRGFEPGAGAGRVL